jgi:hypothetical protein
VPNGSGTGQRLLQVGAQHLRLGTLPGTFRIPSMSSEKQISRVGMSDITSKARRTIVVRATSPKVPIWGRPEGP